MTIRKRLALWYSGLLALIIIIFSLTVITVSRVTILRTMDQVLEDASVGVAHKIQALAPDEMDHLAEEERLLHVPGLSLQIWRTSDSPELIYSSADISDIESPLDPAALENTAESTDGHFSTVTFNNVPERVGVFPLFDANQQQIGMIQLGTSMMTVDHTHDVLLIVIAISATIVIAISIGVGMWIAGRSLMPIEDITQAASHIASTEDLSKRIEWEGPVDELGRLTQVFNEMMERLEHLFSVQQRFIGDVSHELRTPLTSIIGNIELIERYGFDQASFDAIHREAERMKRMVNDLLLLARADYGELEVDFYPVDLDVIALDAYEQAIKLAKNRDLQVLLDHIEPIQMQGNADRLKQLILNLLANAIKFTSDSGQVLLSIAKDGPYAVIVVQDTGIGISEKDLKRIFDRFYQADSARVHRDESYGAGLGLSIVRWIVDIHTGTIDVKSQLGEGATFTVHLPLEASHHTLAPFPIKGKFAPFKIKTVTSPQHPKHHIT